MKLKLNRLSPQAAATTVRSLGIALVSALALSATVAEAVYPANHIYLSYHGRPAYSVTIDHVWGQGRILGNTFRKTCSACKTTYEYNYVPNLFGQRVHVSVTTLGHLNTPYRFSFPYSGDSRDHCLLVKANGIVYSTGDNTTGCHKP